MEAKSSRARRACGLVVALALGLPGCGEETVTPAASPGHAWLNPPAAVPEETVVLSPWLVHPVAAERLAEAVSDLETEPCLQISPGMARHYTAQDVRVPAEMRPFLVRAVGAAGGELTVLQSRRGLWMQGRGGAGAPAARPVVVFVDPTPLEIFVTAD